MTDYDPEDLNESVEEFAPGGSLIITEDENGRGHILTLLFPMLRMDHLVPTEEVGTYEELEAALTMMAELQESAFTFLGLTSYLRAQTRNAMEQILDLIDQPDASVSRLHYLVTGLIEDFDMESDNLRDTAKAEVEEARQAGREENERNARNAE